jgi:arylsulfatase A-like enzyme
MFGRQSFLLCLAVLAACGQQTAEPTQRTISVLDEVSVSSRETSTTLPQLEEAERPNIIFVLVDDQRFDALGFVNSQLDTPHMDRMAEEGIYFPNTFVSTSLCSPSRASILTGMATRNHRIAGNSEPEPADMVFYPAYLQSVGYETALIGKWHMGHGGQPRPGFDYWLSFAGQGNYFPEQHRSGQQMLNLNGEEIPQQGYITDELTDYAIEWIEDREDQEAPFFLHLAHKAVHSNFTPAERHLGQYDGETFVEPMPLTPDNYEGKPRWLFDQRNSWHGVDFPYYSSLDMQELQRRYYATLSAVDDSLGRLIAYLDESGQLDRTMIVLMGDNGFMFGEQGLIDKRNAYDPSIKVPLLVYAPGLFEGGEVREEVVSNMDIAPTMLELAGLGSPDHFDGRSMAPLLRGEKVEDWQNQFVYEYYWDVTYPQTPTTFAIRTDRFKYITYHGIWDLDELYDIVNDPEETTNLISETDYQDEVADLRKRLYAELINAEGKRQISFERKRKTGNVLRNEIRMEAAPFPEEWHREPLEDSAERQ